MRSPSSRKLTNVRFTRPFRARYAGVWLAVSLLFLVASAVFSYLLFVSNWDGLVAADPHLAAARAASEHRFVTLLAVETALLAGGLVALAVFTTHRIAGPLVGLRNTCEAIRGGDFSRRIQFRRRNPELDALADSFNGMMDVVEERVRGGERSA